MVGLPIPVSDNKDMLEEIVSVNYEPSDWGTDQWVAAGYKRATSSLTSAQRTAIENSDFILIVISTGASTDIMDYIGACELIPMKGLINIYKSLNKQSLRYYIPLGVNNSATSTINKLGKMAMMQFSLYQGYGTAYYDSFAWYISMPEDQTSSAYLSIKIYKVNI